MIINKISIENYKSFYDKREISLDLGFNLFLGKNNSGKSTALDFLDLSDSLQKPHRSELSVPTYGGSTQKSSNYWITISTSLEEIRNKKNTELLIPLNENFMQENPGISWEEILNKIKRSTIEITYASINNKVRLKIKTFFGESEYLDRNSRTVVLKFNFSNENSVSNIELLTTTKAAQSIFNAIDEFRSSIYKFSPIRTPKPTYIAQHSNQLLLVLPLKSRHPNYASRAVIRSNSAGAT